MDYFDMTELCILRKYRRKIRGKVPYEHVLSFFEKNLTKHFKIVRSRLEHLFQNTRTQIFFLYFIQSSTVLETV